MPLISLNKISLAYGHHKLLDYSDLQFDLGERIALIGKNGGGKSSLLRIIANEIQPDDGTVWKAPGLEIAYVPQEPKFEVSCTVFEEVSKGLGKVSKILSDYDAVSNLLSRNEGNMNELLLRLQELQSALDSQGGWQIQKRVKDILLKLNLPEEVIVESLSGGQKKRVALARALVLSPDVLLLDEPTNHLDFSSIEWLENLLNNFLGSILFVTHDRRFLENVATRIVELDRGILTTFRCNFAEYMKQKAKIKEIEIEHNQKFNKVLAQEEAWIRQGIKARRTRNEGRVRRLKALRIKREARREQVAGVSLNISKGIESGRMVAELTNIHKRYGDKLIVSDFSCRIMRGDRVGLLGPNGIGKSTLLKLILGRLDPDIGTVRLGSRLTIAYFDQMRDQLDEEATLIETISQGSDFIEIGKIRKHIISYLGDFLFPPQRSRSQVKTLSGGERNRLLLANLFSRPTNVLVLDEPTNDLDIETLELLEELLQDYEGTIFLVSHDRSFLDNVVTQVIVFEGDGILKEYMGGYEDWKCTKNIVNGSNNKSPKSLKKDSSKLKQSKLVSKFRLNFNEVKELELLPARIEMLEKEQANIANKLSDSAIYRDAPDEMIRLKTRFASLEKEVANHLTRWDELEAKKLKFEKDSHS
tara:strand:+ start:4563 stop:6494 length:1932 start_codon:yes stop_codon:yes gene_type:complete